MNNEAKKFSLEFTIKEINERLEKLEKSKGFRLFSEAQEKVLVPSFVEKLQTVAENLHQSMEQICLDELVKCQKELDEINNNA